MEKTDVSNKKIKNDFSCHINCYAKMDISSFKKKKNFNGSSNWPCLVQFGGIYLLPQD